LVPGSAAGEWYKKTGIYPINHMVVVKDEILAANPGLAGSLYEAFSASKEAWLKSATDDDKKAAGHNIVTGDPFPYGLGAENRPALEAIIKYAYNQHIIKREFSVEEI